MATLITGASKGIGKALAEECAQRKMDLVLVARSAALLEALAEDLSEKYGVKTAVFTADLTADDAPDRILDFCKTQDIAVTTLINNAGMSMWGRFDEHTLENHLRLLRLNQESVIRLTHAFLPELAARKRAYIMNVSSTGAFQPAPMLGLYGAGKTMIRHFSLALHHELRNTGVTVTCLNPGPTESEIHIEFGGHDLVKRAGKTMMTAEFVARKAVNAMLKGRAEVTPGLLNKLHKLLAAVFPHSVTTRITAWTLRR